MLEFMTSEQQHRLGRVQERLQVMKSSIRSDDSLEVGWARQEEIVELLENVTSNFSDAVESRRDEHIVVVQKIATIEEKLVRLSHDIAQLCKVVRDGNGQPSMVQRLATLESNSRNQEQQIKEISGYANSINASKMLTRTQLVIGLSGMLITAIMSGAALVATLIKP
jgi:uncharacterized coiled-coil protein SlyX